MAQEGFACCIGASQSYLSAIGHGRNEIGAEVLLAIGRESDKWLEWLLTGEEIGSLSIGTESRVSGREAPSHAKQLYSLRSGKMSLDL